MQGYLYTVKKMITDIKNRSTYTVQKVKDVFSVFPKWLFGFIQHDNGNQKKQTEKQFDKPEHNHIFRRYTENFVHYYHRPDRNQKLFCCKRISSFHCCPLQKMYIERLLSISQYNYINYISLCQYFIVLFSSRICHDKHSESSR